MSGQVREFEPTIDKCPKVGEVWFYKETGSFYTVTDLLKMKIGEAEWIPGVVYFRDGMFFCRDLQTFGEKFAFHRA